RVRPAGAPAQFGDGVRRQGAGRHVVSRLGREGDQPPLAQDLQGTPDDFVLVGTLPIEDFRHRLLIVLGDRTSRAGRVRSPQPLHSGSLPATALHSTPACWQRESLFFYESGAAAARRGPVRARSVSEGRDSTFADASGWWRHSQARSASEASDVSLAYA